MAKGIGLIGNFRGKVGNMVGYNLKDSNNKQTQGVRVYQPVVKNPKTYGQAEQRAKLAPINATYRALKAIIDRGQEGKAYGNKSRLAWLSEAMKSFNGAWFEKGANIDVVSLVPLTKGSLPTVFSLSPSQDNIQIDVQGLVAADTSKVKDLADAIIAAYPSIHDGDQLTFIILDMVGTSIAPVINSIVLDQADESNLPTWLNLADNKLTVESPYGGCSAYALILSREGSNGEHLRSTASIIAGSDYRNTLTQPAAKEAAIKSYMSAGANTDWAEESLQ